jgi:hypothetical protein
MPEAAGRMSGALIRRAPGTLPGVVVTPAAVGRLAPDSQPGVVAALGAMDRRVPAVNARVVAARRAVQHGTPLARAARADTAAGCAEADDADRGRVEHAPERDVCGNDGPLTAVGRVGERRRRRGRRTACENRSSQNECCKYR